MKIKRDLTQKDLEEFDAFFGDQKRRFALFKSPSSLRVQALANKARIIMDRLTNANLLPVQPQEPYIDWWFCYFRLFASGHIQSQEDLFLLRYLYPNGPRYSSSKISRL